MGIQHLLTVGGVVMIPLLVFSVLALALIVERIVFWIKISTRQKPLINKVLSYYRGNNLVSSIEILRQNADLPISRMFLTALELEEPTPEEFRLALESEAQAEIPILKRFQTIFDTIIALSPLLGLLGTVLGLITSFASLNLGNIGGSQATGVTGGIGEALVSTAAGLVVAIVTLMFANTFRGLYQRQLALIQEYGGELELLYRRRYERGRNTYATSR
ncbi:MAG: MotA/TolQ/ExbB proton channel family protein [Cyanobacteria bacterium P01_A01_bin.84]